MRKLIEKVNALTGLEKTVTNFDGFHKSMQV
jgi:hypothetical protein